MAPTQPVSPASPAGGGGDGTGGALGWNMADSAGALYPNIRKLSMFPLTFLALICPVFTQLRQRLPNQRSELIFRINTIRSILAWSMGRMNFHHVIQSMHTNRQLLCRKRRVLYRIQNHVHAILRAL